MVRVPEFFLGILTYRLFREHRFDWMTRNSTVRACLAMFVVLSFVAAAQWSPWDRSIRSTSCTTAP